MDDLRKDIAKINTSLFARIPDLGYIGNWFCLGNILEFLDMIQADINWDKPFENYLYIGQKLKCLKRI